MTVAGARRFQEIRPQSVYIEEICARTEQRAVLKGAIAKLRPTLRNVVELYDLQERSLHETAEVVGISVAAAKGRLFHARAHYAGKQN
jgi:DNA-directed RNA polymerase specialized sigma24 family protein